MIGNYWDQTSSTGIDYSNIEEEYKDRESINTFAFFLTEYATFEWTKSTLCYSNKIPEAINWKRKNFLFFQNSEAFSPR
jgi:hypothetical protein